MEINEQKIREIVKDELKKVKQTNFRSDRLIPVVTGSRSSVAALTSLLKGLQQQGTVVDNSS